MQVKASAASHPGRKRGTNEDSYLADRQMNLFIVADGMGGHAGGEVASNICTTTVREELQRQADILERMASPEGVDRLEILRLLEHAVHVACAEIFRQGQAEPEKRRMGTTCTVLLLGGERAYIAHVGDSRAYLLRDGAVHQLSEDHSLLGELVRHGKLKQSDLARPRFRRYRNAVTRAVGVYESVQVDTLDLEVLPGDRFLLCSDGFHQYAQDPLQIGRMAEASTLRAFATDLIDYANSCGGSDNITVVVVEVPSAKKSSKRAADVSLMIEALQKMPLFRYLDYRELVRVLNISEIHEYNNSDWLIREGSEGDMLFVILRGQIELSKDGTTIATLGPSDHFGELALIDRAPRSASARSKGNTRLLAIKHENFYDVIRDESRMAVKVLWNLAHVLAKRLRSTTEELSEARLSALIDIPTMEVHDTRELRLVTDRVARPQQRNGSNPEVG